jgi:uncharacterized protein
LRDVSPLSPEALRADLATHRGGLLDLARHRFPREAWAPFRYLRVGAFETLALMLTGMAALRSGFLTGEWQPRLYRRIASVCILIGGIGFAALAAVQIRSGFDPRTVFLVQWGGTILFRLVMILGYAALIILLARRGGPIARRFAATGRTAFTNYLGTSLLAACLFYGWGFGLYGHLSRAQAWLAAPALWAVMLLWSKPWLDRFRYGPFEWAWRSLARGSPQPMRR